ncbi:hypothetical protein GCK72_012021 [Caenorhabditis remanei]|uniref:Domain of unknown function WSN domain-containing protein n=1 Tax=Caenorhabditis remanei TaxID=31234 RepID=A0A6A5GLS6_CAERE|nr:hypothetical protein GCK72_012021 [Caenorhabditis remanei]KAF1755571.1 hypothetical protein GCK72_012021 [Caenorhabditis remanei]
MKFCKSEILFAFLWLLVDGQGANKVSQFPNTTALHIVTEKLATLSRVTNGIALQKELNSKSFNVDGLLAEVLGMDSREKGLVELVKIDVEGLKNEYEKIGNDAMTMKVSNLNESEVQSQLGVLGGMEKNVETLKEGIEWDTSEVLQNFTNAYGVKRTIFAESVKEYATALEYFFTDDLSTVNTAEFEKSFKHLRSKTNDFKETCSQLLSFETDLKELWVLIDSTEMFGTIEELAATADVYNRSQNQLNALKTSIEEMQMEFGTIQPILKEINKLSVSQVFDVLRANFEQMNANVVSNRLLTTGFPAGTRDISALFKDLEGKWFRQELARNNETILNQMVSELGSLKKVNENAALVEKSWQLVKSKTELLRIANSSVLWKEMIGRTIDESVFEQLSSSITKIGQCLQPLMPITAQVDSHAFHVVLEKVRNLEFVSKTVYPLLKEISEIEILGNATVFNLFEKELIKTASDSNSFILQNVAAELKKNKSFQELSKRAKQAGDLMSKILETNINEILVDSDHDWTAITHMQKVLENTKLVESLECLKNENFDEAGISNILSFGSTIRLFGENYKTDKSAITFFKKMALLKANYETFINSFAKSRPKRSTQKSIVDSLDNALVVSQDLGKGVSLLRKMRDLYENRKVMVEVTKSGNEVFLELKKVLDTIDTSLFKTQLEKTVQDLDSLESYAKKNSDGDLQKIGGVFEQASTIPGVVVDSRRLVDPVSTSFHTSSDPNIQKSAESFRTLGNLQLDYSSQRSSFKTASLSVLKLRDFFNLVFPAPIILPPTNEIKTTPEPNNETRNVLLGVGAFLVLLIAGLILFGYITYNKRKREDPNSYVHLLESGEESKIERTMKEGTNYVYMPIHDAIITEKYDRLQLCVKKGANVNAYCIYNGLHQTPLHLAVHKGNLKMVKCLIKNGADMTLRDSEYRTPIMVGESDVAMYNLLAKYENKTFLRRIPNELPEEKYLILSEGDDLAFSQKFPEMVTKDPRLATHIVFPVDADGCVVFSEQDLDHMQYLSLFFGPKMMMREEWRNTKPGWLSRRKLGADYNYRVKSVKVNGKRYDTVTRIHQHVQEKRIPFLFGVEAYFPDFKANKRLWTPLKLAMQEAGAIVFCDTVPNVQDKKYREGEDFRSPYYFDNLGPIFIMSNDKENICNQHPFIANNNRFSHFKFLEMVEFLFKFETHHFKLTETQDNTAIEKWDPVNTN